MAARYPGPSQGPKPKTFEVRASLGPDFYPDHSEPLKARDQWLCSQNRQKDQDKKPRKVPIDPANPKGPGIDKTNPKNWMPYDEARRHFEENPLVDHYGFVTQEGDPYTFIDIDERIDKETGEVPPLIMKLVEHLDSYAYSTPNHGVRIVVEGELHGTGGNYVWTAPDTGEEHTFEVYDRKAYLVFTDWVFHDEPIREAQGFLDSLVKKRSGTSPSRKARINNLPEVELPEDLEGARRKIKHLFVKHNLDPSPILKGSRKIDLISYFRTIVRNDPLENAGEPDELWKLINWANETMLYDEHGEHLEGLEEDELWEVYDEVLKDLPQKASKEVQEKLDDLLEFLVAIRVKVSYRQDAKWKVMKALEEHGRKYGRLLSEHEVRVDIGWVALMKQARIASPKTLSKALAKLKKLGILRTGWDEGDRTGHFVIRLKKAMAPYSWDFRDPREMEEEGLYAQGNKSDESYLHHLCIPLHKEITEQVPKEMLEALTHATWYRNMGPTKIRYVLAVLIIERVLEEEATSTKVAQMLGVKPSSVSRPLRELREAEVIRQDKTRGHYRVDERVAEDLYRLRSKKGEFDRDEVAKRKAQDQRRFFAYELKLGDTILHLIEDGSNPDHALRLAKDLVPPPTGIDEYQLGKHQEWALNRAKKEQRRSEAKNEDVRKGAA